MTTEQAVRTLTPLDAKAKLEQDPETQVVDTAPAPDWAGGHVPGAQSIPWSSAVNEDSTFKSAAELAALYGGKGVTADKATIAYCRIGERLSLIHISEPTRH